MRMLMYDTGVTGDQQEPHAPITDWYLDMVREQMAMR